jgi:hypothetical protein
MGVGLVLVLGLGTFSHLRHAATFVHAFTNNSEKCNTLLLGICLRDKSNPAEMCNTLLLGICSCDKMVGNVRIRAVGLGLGLGSVLVEASC